MWRRDILNNNSQGMHFSSRWLGNKRNTLKPSIYTLLFCKAAGEFLLILFGSFSSQFYSLIQLRGLLFIGRWRHTDLCAHTPKLRGRHTPSPLQTWKQGSRYLRRGPLYPCGSVRCPALTLPSEQTRLHWWTRAGLFTPRVKVLWGWLSVSEEEKL